MAITKTATIKYAPLSPKHKAYIREALKNRMNVAEGAIRSGKTIDNCIISAIYLETCPDVFHLASGSTIANAKLNIAVCNGFGLEYLFRGRCQWKKYRDNDALFIKTQTGTKIVIFAGGAKADSYRKILGNSYGLWVATEINEHYDCEDSRSSFIKVAFGRQIASQKPLVLWDLNPCNPNNSIYTDYIDKYQEGFVGGYQYKQFTIADNLSISAERRAQIESQYTVGSVWYRRDILGERCIAEGLIYPKWEEALGEPPERKYDKAGNWLNPPSERVVSVDYGTMNAFACLLWEKYDSVWYATREYYWSGRDTGIQKTDSEYEQEMEAWLADILEVAPYHRLDVIIDPSAKSFITLLKRFSCWKVHTADNAVEDGIRETANAMQNGYIVISSKLEHTKDELGGYRYDPKATEDVPIKEKDHLMDALRYFVKTMKIIKRALRRTY
jgi:PBSX family phage terminase large subunit